MAKKDLLKGLLLGAAISAGSLVSAQSGHTGSKLPGNQSGIEPAVVVRYDAQKQFASISPVNSRTIIDVQDVKLNLTAGQLIGFKKTKKDNIVLIPANGFSAIYHS